MIFVFMTRCLSVVGQYTKTIQNQNNTEKKPKKIHVTMTSPSCESGGNNATTTRMEYGKENKNVKEVDNKDNNKNFNETNQEEEEEVPAVPVVTNDDNSSSSTTKMTNMGTAVDETKTLHIAPMLDVTNVEFRQLMRILSKKCVLWTEMVVDETILFTNDLDFHLPYVYNNDDDDKNKNKNNNSISPIVCQVGGNDPDSIYKACLIILERGYDEININMDCPSNRVSGVRQFGAVLMRKIEVAEAAVKAIRDASEAYFFAHDNTTTNASTTTDTKQGRKRERRNVSIKCRIGIDELDDIEYLTKFIRRLSKYCSIFYLHARKCVLGGILTPAQNRAIPPLNYPRVYEICNIFPHLHFYINAGIPDLSTAKEICYGKPKTKNIHTRIRKVEAAVATNNINTSTSGSNNDIQQSAKIINSNDGKDGKVIGRVQQPYHQELRQSVEKNDDTFHHVYDDDDEEENETSSSTEQYHHRLQHQVPCKICNFPNGSCIATLDAKYVPKNLRGCMIGRTARDNPCILWDVDRYFYNMEHNPCTNRRQVIDQYCQYLSSIYPRRCCDDLNSVVTKKIQQQNDSEKSTMDLSSSSDKNDDDNNGNDNDNSNDIIYPEYDCCPLCKEFYIEDQQRQEQQQQLSGRKQNGNDNDGHTATTKEEEEEAATASTTRNIRVAPSHYIKDGTYKITTHVLYRATRPIAGIFFGLPKAKLFRRELDRLIQQDRNGRNCGPSIIIRRAIKATIPEYVLDKPFIKTEDIHVDTPTYVGRSNRDYIADCCNATNNGTEIRRGRKETK